MKCDSDRHGVSRLPCWYSAQAHLRRRLTQERGKLADFVVVDTDILESDVDEIRDAKVLTTYLGGRIIYKEEN